MGNLSDFMRIDLALISKPGQMSGWLLSMFFSLINCIVTLLSPLELS